MKTKWIARMWISAWALMLAVSGLAANDAYEPKHGDVVFQALGKSPLIEMIEGCTRSEYSHCGIVALKDGKWMVIEAIGPVREIPLSEWIHQGRKDGFAAYRLTLPHRGKADEFVKAAYTYLGRPYDIHYELDDKKIYCSELVFKAFRSATGEKLGRLAKLKELDWKPYENLIRELEGGAPPLEREIITPANLAAATQLERVYTRDIAASTGKK
jgi:hypothetical protein